MISQSEYSKLDYISRINVIAHNVKLLLQHKFLFKFIFVNENELQEQADVSNVLSGDIFSHTIVTYSNLHYYDNSVFDIVIPYNIVKLENACKNFENYSTFESQFIKSIDTVDERQLDRYILFMNEVHTKSNSLSLLETQLIQLISEYLQISEPISNIVVYDENSNDVKTLRASSSGTFSNNFRPVVQLNQDDEFIKILSLIDIDLELRLFKTRSLRLLQQEYYGYFDRGFKNIPAILLNLLIDRVDLSQFKTKNCELKLKYI